MVKNNRLDLGVIQFRFHLLVLGEFTRGLHEVFLDDVVAERPDRVDTGLCTNIAQICAVKALGELDDCVVVDVSFLRKLS